MSEPIYIPDLLCTVPFGRRRDRTVATLGDRLASTCSIEFAKTWLAPEGGVILGFGSFEEASAAVTAGHAQYLVVPGAYPDIRNFIFDPRLRFEDQFVDRLPDIVLISGNAKSSDVKAPVRLYHHAALQEVVAELKRNWPLTDYQTVSSNPVACERTLADPDSLALTNVIAARAYGVAVLRVMRQGWTMPCVVYRAEDAPQPIEDLRPWLGARPRPSAKPR